MHAWVSETDINIATEPLSKTSQLRQNIPMAEPSIVSSPIDTGI